MKYKALKPFFKQTPRSNYDVKYNIFLHRYRVCVFGKYMEVKAYEEVQFRHQDEQRANRVVTLGQALKVRADSVRNRAAENVYQTIAANHGAYGSCKTSFLTLTFARNETNLKNANKHFNLFVKRLKYMTKIDIQYLAVAEFQQRGAVHYHIILFNVPRGFSVEQVEKVWGHGMVNWKVLKAVTNIAAYVTKYITKAQDTAHGIASGQKSYFTSRGLIRPQVLFLDSIDNVADWDRLMLLKTEAYESTYCGHITKSLYEYRHIKD